MRIGAAILSVIALLLATSASFELGRQGDVDAVLVHSLKAEEKFISEGHGTRRTEIMYNDFVFVGPKVDPAKIKGVKDAKTALAKIASTKSAFVSRGDDSGTHPQYSQWSQRLYSCRSGFMA